MSDSGPVAASPPPHSLAPAASRRYRAFISYSHTDTKWARWLMRRLESFSVPRRFHGRAAPIGVVDRRIAPVFRDRDELPTTSDLGETIRAALRESATLIVICSPASAKSRWVQEEITAFKRLHGERGVFAFIVSGEPKIADAPDDCFSPALRTEVGADGELSGAPAEVVAADARHEGDGPKLAFVRLVAGLLGVGFDELRQRELQRRNRRLVAVSGFSLVGMAVTLGLAVVAWQARNDAERRQEQAEGVLTFMLGDFRDELKNLGRLALLDRVGEKSTEYFDSLAPGDLTDRALARQAKALTQIGENQLEQAKYPAAARAFLTAYQRAAALSERHARAPEILFERGQAEYWIGEVHRRQGNLAAANEWFTRYRDTSAVLVAIAAHNPKWQLELASGEHNLAALHLERGDFDAAQKGFEAKLATITRLLEADPQNAELIYRVANTRSWLGTVAERRGDFAEALAHFEGEAAGHAANAARAPQTARWRFQRADCLLLQASMLVVTGRRAEAHARLLEGRALLDRLVEHDPANREWLLIALAYRLKLGSLEIAEGRFAEAAEIIAAARSTLETFAAAAPSDRSVRVRLAMAWRMEAELRRALRRDDAPEAARRALELAEANIRQQSRNFRAEAADACLVSALVAQDRNDQAAVVRHAKRALELLDDWEKTNHWRVLDPAARGLALSGRREEAGQIIRRLERSLYKPLQPWPDLAAPTNLSATKTNN